MQWISVTLASGRASLVDGSKVMYVTESDDGCRLHFAHSAVDAKGKPVPHGLNVKGTLEDLAKSLKGRKFF